MYIDYSRALILLSFLFIFNNGFSQDDPILFTVGDAEVGVSEFDYIYSKTNGDEATYTDASLREYLDLYMKFKLKVQEAKRIKMDTIPKLQRELDTYRRQLADSYLMDKEVSQKLAQEAYARMQEDVKVNHILASVPPNAPEKDVKAALDKLAKAKSELATGAPFGKVAVKYTDHKPSRLRGGNLGFMTAILPTGFYDMETAIYENEIGKISDPIRTKLGFHLIQVVERRPARGKMDLAHILVRNQDSRADSKEVAIIDSAYARLERGMEWQTVTSMLSEDKQSSNKNGFIGSYGIGLLEPVFEDAAFAIEKDGGYSKPFKSSVGWHIVKRISKKGGEPFNVLKEQILKTLKETERQAIAKSALIENIKIETGYKLDQAVLDHFISEQNKTFFTYKWKPTGLHGDAILFQLKGEYPQTINDFEAFIARAARARMRMGDKTDLKEGITEIFNLFAEEIALKYEEKNLLKKYSDFRNLMREYEEGILLFEVTDQEVWSKASKDTSGLRAFFKTVDGRYRWADKAKVSTIVINSTDTKIVNKAKKWASKKGVDFLAAKLKKKGIEVSITEIEVEKGKDKTIDKMAWVKNSASEVITGQSESTFSIIKEVIKGRSKTLKESRGYVIADYQEYLEKQWIVELRQRFTYKLDEAVLKSLTKS